MGFRHLPLRASFVDEDVAHAAHCLNPRLRIRARRQLLANAADVHIDAAIAALQWTTQRLLRQLLLADDITGMTNQHRQQIECREEGCVEVGVTFQTLPCRRSQLKRGPTCGGTIGSNTQKYHVHKVVRQLFSFQCSGYTLENAVVVQRQFSKNKR